MAAVSKITNEKRASIMVANQLIIRAGELTTVENGVALTAEQQAANYQAELLAEYGNTIRENWGLDPMPVTPPAPFSSGYSNG